MTISHFELKILRYMCRLSKRARRAFSNNLLCKKFGEGSLYAVDLLYKNGYIDCPTSSTEEYCFSSGVLPIKDKWQITDKGIFCVADNKLVVTLSVKERLLNFFYGFAAGLISGCGIQLFTHYVIIK